jgi:hypothetical protein
MAQLVDPYCANTAKIRARDSSYYIYSSDIEDLRQHVYERTYDDCVSWKVKHGE